MLVVVLDDKIFVFNFETLKLMEQIDTYTNSVGLCGICTADKPI